MKSIFAPENLHITRDWVVEDLKYRLGWAKGLFPSGQKLSGNAIMAALVPAAFATEALAQPGVQPRPAEAVAAEAAPIPVRPLDRLGDYPFAANIAEALDSRHLALIFSASVQEGVLQEGDRLAFFAAFARERGIQGTTVNVAPGTAFPFMVYQNGGIAGSRRDPRGDARIAWQGQHAFGARTVEVARQDGSVITYGIVTEVNPADGRACFNVVPLSVTPPLQGLETGGGQAMPAFQEKEVSTTIIQNNYYIVEESPYYGGERDRYEFEPRVRLNFHFRSDRRRDSYRRYRGDSRYGRDRGERRHVSTRRSHRRKPDYGGHQEVRRHPGARSVNRDRTVRSRPLSDRQEMRGERRHGRQRGDRNQDYRNSPARQVERAPDPEHGRSWRN